MSRSAPVPRAIEEQAASRNTEDRRQAWTLIGLGIPFGIIGMFFLQAVLGFLIWMAPIDWNFGESMSVAGFLVVVAVIIDVWRHPSEQWVRTRYTLVGGGTSDPRFSLVTQKTLGGAFSGMPLMTNMSDPGNAAARMGAIANGCGNVVLGGPRNIRKGIELLLIVRARSRKDSLDAAHRFLEWLAARDPVPEDDLEGELQDHPILIRGFLVADELEFIARRNGPDGRVIDLR